MFSKRHDRPVAKVLVQSDENSTIGYGPLKDLKIVGAILAYLGRSHHVIALASKFLGYFEAQALV
jgi:hypothetical protein